MKNTFNPNILAAIIIGVALIIGLAVINTEKKSDYITVGGQSEVVINPDKAVVYLSTSTVENTAQEAQDANAKIIEKIKSDLKNSGVLDQNIETSSYYLNRKTDWTEAGPVEKGYEQIHTLKITSSVTDASNIAKIAVNAGANSIDRIEFLVSREGQNAAVAEAMKQATLSAREKAKTVVNSVDARLGRVLKVEEGNWWIVTSSESSGTNDLIPEGYSGDVITPQRMAVQANVNVVFAVN